MAWVRSTVRTVLRLTFGLRRPVKACAATQDRPLQSRSRRAVNIAGLLSLVSGLLATTFVVVPLDDRPVTLQLPRMLGAIAGVRVAEPPRVILGNYLRFGDPDAVARWLVRESPPDASAFIVSADMLAYGGLIASRTPQTPEFLALARLRRLADFRATRAAAAFSAFGTVMRLAPTGVPQAGSASGFFAAGAAWPLIQKYANLPDPPVAPADRATALRVRAAAGPTLVSYLATRARDRDVDLFELQLLAEGGFDRLILGQDDAGPVGLHLRDLAALRAYLHQWSLGAVGSIEPGADELAMALVGAALARQAAFVPRIAVTYSTSAGGALNDPLEFNPIDSTVDALIHASGARRTATLPDADIELFVRVPGTLASDERAFVDALQTAVQNGRPAAVADLTFLAQDDYVQQRALVDELLRRRIAGKIAGFASWNTTANTLGTAIPAAVAVVAGERMGTYDPRAHAQFMLDRYADDYAFHAYTRPAINRLLVRRGIADHTYLLPIVAEQAGWADRADLWPRSLALLATIYPQYRDGGLTITLPWDRTFETELDIRLRDAPAKAR